MLPVLACLRPHFCGADPEGTLGGNYIIVKSKLIEEKNGIYSDTKGEKRHMSSV
jgi:hypothetical protein